MQGLTDRSAAKLTDSQSLQTARACRQTKLPNS